MRSIPPISKFHTLLHNGAKKIREIANFHSHNDFTIFFLRHQLPSNKMLINILQRRCLLFQPGSNIRSVKILRDFGEIVLWYKITKSMFISFHFCFSSVLVIKLRKYYVTFVYILQGKMGKAVKKRKENHATKVTKIPKYGMNETHVNRTWQKHFKLKLWLH